MTLSYKEMGSPVGKLRLVANAAALVAVLWEKEQPNGVRLGSMNFNPDHPVLKETERQLTEYFRAREESSICRSRRAAANFRKKSGRL